MRDGVDELVVKMLLGLPFDEKKAQRRAKEISDRVKAGLDSRVVERGKMGMFSLDENPEYLRVVRQNERLRRENKRLKARIQELKDLDFYGRAVNG